MFVSNHFIGLASVTQRYVRLAKLRTPFKGDETLQGRSGLFRYSSLWAAFRSGFCVGNEALADRRQSYVCIRIDRSLNGKRGKH
ncbi:hypothetical protein H6F76_29370 [Leptolyngbya sp. FACHB-321]|nr:hypothetical protein [Leptolyngbya sp. FACHB-321]